MSCQHARKPRRHPRRAGRGSRSSVVVRAPDIATLTPLAAAVAAALVGPAQTLERYSKLVPALALGLTLSVAVQAKGPLHAAPAPRKELVVVDPSVVGHAGLLAGARPGLEQVLLDPHRDGLEQLGALMAARPQVRVVHLLAHGEAGGVKLGSGWVRREHLEARMDAVSQWFAAPAADSRAARPELLVYGCNVAKGAAGAGFVTLLSTLTGADVAASDDLTGARSRGGDWLLEKTSGFIDSPLAFSAAASAAYPGVLADIPVDRFDDVVDFADAQQIDDLPGDDGLISLREAVIAANNTAGADIINLPAGTFTLSLTGADEDFAATGDLDITDDTVGAITIRGAGAGLTTINANGLDRVLHVLSGASLTLEHTTVTGGSGVSEGGGIRNDGTAYLSNSTVSGNSASSGGGISNYFGNATLTDSIVSGNSASYGGGIDNYAGTATLSNSTVSGNSATSGGGIRNYDDIEILSNSTVSGNTASGKGGGISNDDGTATLTNSTVSGNSASGKGGGISNNYYGTAILSLTSSTVSGNSASSGGGIYNYYYGNATLTDSIISGNSASGEGGGIRNTGTAILSLTSSTVSGNSASSGGGIYNDYGTATLGNSTVSGNSASSGGGIYNYSGTATLTNSTVSGNAADYGGGISNYSGTATLSNSIISGNTATMSGAEIDNAGTLTADAFNLVGYLGSERSLGFTPGASDIVPADALATVLDANLAENGGPTQTHALVAGSPAIDAVTGCADSPTTDQRDVPRPQALVCDIGAFEAEDSDGDNVVDVNDAFPMDPNESVDSDGDLIGDNSDAFPMNPNESVDSDGDLMGDNFENAFGLNPNLDDAGEDPDKDGDSNLMEFLKNTHPFVHKAAAAIITIINTILLD